MKKIVSLILALVMMMSLSTVAFAANTDVTQESAQTGNMTVKYTVSDGYTVSIPDEIAIDGDATITATNVKIDPTKKLQVTVVSANQWLLKNGADANVTLAYDLKIGDDVLADSDVVLEAAAGTETKSVTLSAALDTGVEATQSGSYTDTLTFTVALVAA